MNDKFKIGDWVVVDNLTPLKEYIIEGHIGDVFQIVATDFDGSRMWYFSDRRVEIWGICFTKHHLRLATLNEIREVADEHADIIYSEYNYLCEKPLKIV